MSTPQSALLDWNLSRVTRVAVSVVAVFLAFRLTDEFLPGLGMAIILAIVIDIPWWLHTRYVAQSKGE